MTSQEFEEWKTDISGAENTHPNSFANGPFLKALFRVSQEIDSTSQMISYLKRQVYQVSVSLDNLTKEIQDFSKVTTELSGKANKLIWWYVILTAVIAGATIINLFL